MIHPKNDKVIKFRIICITKKTWEQYHKFKSDLIFIIKGIYRGAMC